FEEVTFDGNDQVATAIYIDDILTSAKDGGFENQYRGTRDKLWDLGLNLEWQATDNLTFVLDGHHAKAEALPNNPLGHTSTLFSLAHKGVADQQLTIVDGFPQQTITFDDSINGNNNGVLDLPDLGSQVARSQTSWQTQEVDEVRLDATWEMGDDDRVQFGGSFRSASMNQSAISTYDALGDWGVASVGDIAATAGDLVQEFCMVCEFRDFDAGATGASLIAYRGDATALYTAFGVPGSVNGTQDNNVDEDIWAIYAQVDINTELMGRPVNIVAGVRYENTKSESISFQGIPQRLDWGQNN